MKTNAPTNQLIGDMPKIGIRPTIDGRLGGVRESLEDLTMDMAKNVATFLSENLRHYNGLPVECVIADRNIGGVAEAAACAEKFQREGVGVSLTVTPCWCYGSETMDMDPHLPKAIWGFNGTERPGAVYLAAVSAAHNQKGLPVFNIYGRDVQDVGDDSIPEDVQDQAAPFAKAGLAVASMRGKSYLSMGGVSMGIGGFHRQSGPFRRLLRHARRGHRHGRVCAPHGTKASTMPDEFEKALAWVKENCPEGKDYNPEADQRSREQKDEDLGHLGQDGADRARPDGRQPQAGRNGLWRRGPGPQCHRRRFPGPAPVDRSSAQWRFPGSDPQLVVRLERHSSALYRGYRERRAATASPCCLAIY